MFSGEILVAVTNYDFSDNADELRRAFAQYLPTVLIDADSPVPPRETDLHIRNDYYPGLWNAAVAQAIARGAPWLMFVASDLQIPDVRLLCECAVEAIALDGVGVYTPSLVPGSRVSFDRCVNRTLASIRDVGVVEGFFFLARTDILRRLHPIPTYNTFGWGVDVFACYTAEQMGYGVVVDDRVFIHHPRRRDEHAIDDTAANALWARYLGPRVLRWAEERRREPSGPTRLWRRTSCLDLGCGPEIRNVFGCQDVSGVDSGPAADPRIVQADVFLEPIPFAARSFDYVTALDFLPRQQGLLDGEDPGSPLVPLMNEVHRVLKPGGLFLSVSPVAVPVGQDPAASADEERLGAFCAEDPAARPGGFEGRFLMVLQRRDGARLISFLRALSSPREGASLPCGELVS